MPFEGVPKFYKSPNDSDTNTDHVRMFVAAKIAEIKKQPESPFKDAFLTELEEITEHIQNGHVGEIIDVLMQKYGYHTADGAVADKDRETVLVSEGINTPAPEQQHVECSLDYTALEAQAKELQSVLTSYNEEVKQNLKFGVGSEGTLQKRSLAYANIDFRKWQRIATQLGQLRPDQYMRQQQLGSLLQLHYDRLVSNLNQYKPGTIMPGVYKIPSAPVKVEEALLVANANESVLQTQKLEASETLLYEVSQEDIAEKYRSRLIEIEQIVSANTTIDPESRSDLKKMMDYVRDTLVDYENLAQSNFSPREYARKTLVLKNSMHLLEEAVAAISSESDRERAEQNTGDELVQNPPVVDSQTLILGARERLADDERFKLVCDELEKQNLDTTDDNFVRNCIENYNQHINKGEVQAAGSYLHNLEEVLARKQLQQESRSVPHGEILGRLAVLDEAIQNMRIVDTENATTLSALVANVRRLLQEVTEDPSREPALQATYQSLEALYNDFMQSDRDTIQENTQTLNEEMAATVLPEPSASTVVTTPKIEGVAARELRPLEVRSAEAKEKLKERLRAWWNRLKPNPKAWLLAAVTAVATPTEVAKTVNIEPTIVSGASLSGFGPKASWGSDGGVNLETVREATELVVEVRPNTGEVAEAEASESVASISVPIPESSLTIPSSPGKSEISKPDAIPAIVEEPVAVESIELDPKSPDSEEGVSINETETGANVIEILGGKENIHTLPDNAVDTVFATVDTTGLPAVLVTRVWNEEKFAFLNSRERLIQAGVKSGDKNVTFSGEKIDYTDPKNAFEQRIAELRMYLNVPHTEVVLEDSNLTKTTLKSYDADLQVVPESDRLEVVEDALQEFLTTPGALERLKLQNKDNILAGTVTYLGDLAPYIATSVREYTKDQLAKAELESVEMAGAETKESVSVTEPVNMSSQPLSPETYPGGALKYSADYNQLLTSMGIDPVPPTVTAFDSWFAPKKPDNRAILDMSVGDLTTLMLRTPGEIVQELSLLQIDPQTADRVYRVIQDLRKAHFGKYGSKEKITVKEALDHYVLDTVPRQAG